MEITEIRQVELAEYAEQQREAILSDIQSGHIMTDLSQGAELEFSLVNDRTGEPVVESDRDAIVAKCAPVVQKIGANLTYELGASSVEIQTFPVPVRSGLAQAITEAVQRPIEVLDGICSSRGIAVIGAGTLGGRGVRATTSVKKYQEVPRYHNERRRRSVSMQIGAGATELPGAEVIAATNSIHVNIAARNPEEAVCIANYGLAVEGLLTAILANASIIEGNETSFDDIRLEAWCRSHDTRGALEVIEGVPTRAGLPEKYFDSIPDYLDRIMATSSILDVQNDAALAAKIGTYWKPVRIKFPSQDKGRLLLTEWRMASAQPSMVETIAAWIFMAGLAEAARNELVRLPDFGIVRENSWRGHRGINRMFLVQDERGDVTSVSGRTAARQLFELSRQGLNCCGALDKKADELIRVIEERTLAGLTPASILRNVVRQYSWRMPLEKAIAMAQLHLQRVM